MVQLLGAMGVMGGRGLRDCKKLMLSKFSSTKLKLYCHVAGKLYVHVVVPLAKFCCMGGEDGTVSFFP